jgi:hypothetical protein
MALRERRLMGALARRSSVSQQVGLLFVVLFGLLALVDHRRLQPLPARLPPEQAALRERFARELRALWLGALVFWVAGRRGRSARRCCSASSRSSRCASSSPSPTRAAPTTAPCCSRSS